MSFKFVIVAALSAVQEADDLHLNFSRCWLFKHPSRTHKNIGGRVLILFGINLTFSYNKIDKLLQRFFFIIFWFHFEHLPNFLIQILECFFLLYIDFGEFFITDVVSFVFLSLTITNKLPERFYKCILFKSFCNNLTFQETKERRMPIDGDYEYKHYILYTIVMSHSERLRLLA